MISKCIPRNSIQDPPSQRVKESKKIPISKISKNLKEKKRSLIKKKNRKKIEMEIRRTYQFRPSKDSEGDPKNEAKKRLVKCFFCLKKKTKKYFRS